MGAPLHGKWTAFIKFLHSASPAQLPESLSYKKPAHKHTHKSQFCQQFLMFILLHLQFFLSHTNITKIEASDMCS